MKRKNFPAAVMFLLGAALAAGQVSFRGIYNGTASDGTSFAFYISSNYDVTVLLQDIPSKNFGAITTPVIGADGKFTFDYNFSRVSGTVTAAGTVTGAVPLQNATFTAQRVSPLGPVQDLAGAYGGWLLDPNGRLLSYWCLVTPQGQFYQYIKDGATVTETGVGTIDARGFFSFTNGVGVTQSGSVQSAFGGGSLNGRYFKPGVGSQTFIVAKESASHRMGNLSTRGTVGTGQNILIVGFSVNNGAKTLLVRATGPGLAQFNVTGTLDNPRVAVFRDQALVAANDNWGDNANRDEIVALSAKVGAFALAEGSTDSAMLIRLENGSYTAQVSGVGGTTGIALVEVYEID